jgi:glyoxylase-like metal-dependent hydrolase (beta-lactamase superfamily II)
MLQEAHLSMRGRGMIAKGIYMIGGPDISDYGDAASFVIAFGNELVMIDAGAGFRPQIIEKNIRDLGLQPESISQIILTHCHIDHIGGSSYFREKFGCRIVAHELDAAVIERADFIQTAAKWYETSVSPVEVEVKLSGGHEIMQFGDECLHCVHIPGHTPGSISVFIDREGQRILFGQDIHGPFNSYFKSDIDAWRRSMEKLIDLEADILCEGHYGIFEPKDKVERYIRRCLRNQA